MDNEIDDETVKHVFAPSGRINGNFLKEKWRRMNPDICTYIDSRYSDSGGFYESVYRICHGIDSRPVCAMCGGRVSFCPSHMKTRERISPFSEYCSRKCAHHSAKVAKKTESTCLHKYGVSNPARNRQVKKKRECTVMAKYSCCNVFASDEVKAKIENTMIQRYGVRHAAEIAGLSEKKKITCLERFGAENYAKTAEFKELIRVRHDEISAKITAKKRENRSFNISAVEDRIYGFLSESYTVLRQYRSDLYPFCCDFYVSEANLYIEYQGSWTHGGHPYDSEADSDKLAEWVRKSESNQYYRNAVNTWTILDVRKRWTAAAAGLNFLEIFGRPDFEKITAAVRGYVDGTFTGSKLIL